MTRRLCAAAFVAVAIAVAAAPGSALAGPTRRSAPRQAPRSSTPPMTLIDQPVAVAPDGTFPVFLAVDGAPEAVEIAIDIYGKAQPDDIVGVEPDEDAEATFPTVALPPATTGTRTTAFTIALYADGEANPDPAWGWEIDEPGVYPVRIRLLDADGNRLDTMMTSIVRLPAADQRVSQTEASLLVSVHRPPPDERADRAATDTADPELLDQLDAVIAELNARPGLPATFSVTPDTLARIAGDDSAAEQLGRLRAALEPDGRALIDAPYVSIDAASLVSAALPDTITLERDLGRQTLSELLTAPQAGTWQLDDRVDAATLAELRTRGIYRTLLPGDAMARGAGVLAPVDLPAGDGTLRALAVSDAYAVSRTGTDDPVLAAHRLLGRLAAAGPGPTGRAGVVVEVDPAEVAPETLRIVADALAFGSPFWTSGTVDDLLEAPRAPGSVSLATPRQPVLGTYPRAYRRSTSSLASYAAMVSNRPELIRPYQLDLAISAARDLPLDQRVLDANSVQLDLREPFTSITIPTKDKITLGARDARFPLPIESELEYPVKVVIELQANDRLDFPNNRIEATLEEGRQVVPIRVKTRTAGDTPVRITVRSPDDGVILAESQYTIRSTAVSGVGVVLTIGAAAFLVLWWGRHWHRNRPDRTDPSDPSGAEATVDATV